MKLNAALLALGLLPMCATAVVAQPTKPLTQNKARPPIDIVFAIDCSGSMGGVIETAKQKVWDIVNEVAKAKPSPHLRIGLLGYGNADQVYRQFDLSDDLDTVYANLTKFKDEGWSDEYVGRAIEKCLKEMTWAPNENSGPSLRIIYVLGNETAAQGPVSYLDSAKAAQQKDIFVNAVFCGRESGQDTWQQMAASGGGKYLEIAANGGSVVFATPFDQKLAELNTKLNQTYMAYGANGAVALQNQMAQDANSATVGGAYSLSARAAAKASAQYNNSKWDLLDAMKDKTVELEKLKTEDLPESMRTMTPAQRKEHIAKMGKEREAIQKEILQINKERQAYVDAEMKKRGKANGLDGAMRGAFGGQAAAGGFGGFAGN